MLVTRSAMVEAERHFFEGRSPEPWMDEAGRLCAAAILDFFPEPAQAEVYCGKGNNGGDALVVALWLKRAGWHVRLRLAGDLSPLAHRKLGEFEAEPDPSRVPRPRPLVLVDGLLGIGATGGPRGSALELAAEMNDRRTRAGATTFAIDLPSGFDVDTGEAWPGAVVADFTLSITAAKVGFTKDGAEDHLGRLVEIPLDIPVPKVDETRRFLFPSNLRPRLTRRLFNTHKGTAGRVVIAAGSRGMTGAAILAGLGASRGGAGLVTLCVPEDLYEIVASACPPEIMVVAYRDFQEVATRTADALAVGPGLGPNPLPGLANLLVENTTPTVLDADALNFLSRRPALLGSLPPGRLLTPHPGEMARLSPATQHLDRASAALAFTHRHQVTLLLKGARSLVATQGRPLEWNTTGHAGMASGGMGDVLTGLSAALAAGGLDLHDAACLGSWLLGRAAEEALIRGRIAPEAISATMVAEHLGAARRALSLPEAP